MRRISYVTVALMAAWLNVVAALANQTDEPSTTSLPTDSVGIDNEEEEVGDTAVSIHKNSATGFNAIDYVMERRYRGSGYQFTTAWDDHLFIELGAGLRQVVPASDGYGLTTATTAHFALGKQFSPLHTVRLSLSGSYSYRRTNYAGFAQLGAAADWIYSFSTYYEGYKPSRTLDISTVLGFGAHYKPRVAANEKKLAGDVHAGLQFRIYTGPQAYFVVEPQVGVASDNIDLSGNHNWRKYDFFYGANVNFVYFLHNNLSPEERGRYLDKQKDGKLPPQWHTPWFFELAGGLNMASSDELSLGETLGNSTTASVGKWLSPVIGLRGSAAFTTTTWKKTPVSTTSNENGYTQSQPYFNVGVRMEGMVNLLGFLNDFSWEKPFGFYIIAGGGVGIIQKNQSKKLRCKAVSYSAGLKLWARLAQDVQFFVEPRYTYYDYKVPYSNVSMFRRCNENGFALNVGMSLYTRSRRYQNTAASANAASTSKDGVSFSVGLGLGTNLVPKRSHYDGGGLPYNFLAYGECHYNSLSSVRLSLEYMSLSANSLESSWDLELNSTSANNNRKSCKAMWNRRYHLGMLSLNYMLNATTLWAGRAHRRFEIEAFAGPTILFRIGDSANLADGETVAEGHAYQTRRSMKKASVYGANGGFKLKYNATDNIAISLTPQIYVLKGYISLPGVQFMKGHVTETLNLGAQYNF